MLRSLFAGISGLRANQTMLDVTGNNIANANTVGFKSSATVFQDTLTQMLTASSAPSATRGGTNPIQIGLGVQVAATNSRFTQGSNQTTGVGTDMMINGDGFFVINDGASQYYTRAGNFSFDASGNLVAADGKYVMGFNAASYQGYVAGDDGVAPAYTIANPVAWFAALDQSSNATVLQAISAAKSSAGTAAAQAVAAAVAFSAVETAANAATSPPSVGFDADSSGGYSTAELAAVQANPTYKAIYDAAYDTALTTNFANLASPTAGEVTSWKGWISAAVASAAAATSDPGIQAATTPIATAASGAATASLYTTTYDASYVPPNTVDQAVVAATTAVVNNAIAAAIADPSYPAALDQAAIKAVNAQMAQSVVDSLNGGTPYVLGTDTGLDAIYSAVLNVTVPPFGTAHAPTGGELTTWVGAVSTAVGTAIAANDTSPVLLAAFDADTSGALDAGEQATALAAGMTNVTSPLISAAFPTALATSQSNIDAAVRNAAIAPNFTFADPANPTVTEIAAWKQAIASAILGAGGTTAMANAATANSIVNATAYTTPFNTAYNTSINTTGFIPDGAAGTIRVFRENLDGTVEQLFSMTGLELLANVTNTATPAAQDVVNALNANSALRQWFTASLDANGQLVLTAAKSEALQGATLHFVQTQGFAAAVPTAPTLSEVTASTIGGEALQSTIGLSPVESLNPVTTTYETNLSIINLANNATLIPTGPSGSQPQLQSYEIGSDGTVVGVYSDGSKLAIAQLAIANFTNPMGLTKVGNTQFAESSNSGAVQIGTSGESLPGTGQNGTLTVGSVEMSNVDLAAEFTNLILAQRGFEASSKVITTSDTVLGTLVNMVRG